ncbi:MAG TPA: hypothetical protein PLM93_02270 [Sulfuricurvum sp.]|nr:MAG: hypothetical protein B7Y30_08090 [Campylobacterales bacterium 16-40-21]OZA03996.1 MAG: hypothetical protein B7X89_00125 [Sulfuricurvum sp. 17-40-25]HQS65996.1 hypothetical protein [Sulfuricurvum sp.]HQT37039.1 hypothetical protein [Sulfuricurvum sp.]
MNKIGIGVDYSNICKDYNTSYLDRDNKDPATSKCMKQVLEWTQEFLSELIKNFDFKMYQLHSEIPLKIDDIASKRFLFYSLEKEIMLQDYVLQKEYVQYDNSTAWAEQNNDSVLIQNDEDGSGLYFFMEANSSMHQWMLNKLQRFSLDEIDFPTK